MEPRPLPGTISARMLLRVVDFCRARGHDPADLCLRVGLAEGALTHPDARVHYETAVRLGERALEITQDENFGLHLACDVRDTGNADAGVLLLMASPTVRVAFERLVAHQRYWGDGDRVSLRPVRNGAALRYQLPGVTGAYARHTDECAMAELAIGVRFLTGAKLAAQVVRFRHEGPRDLTEHHEIFGCALEFGAEHTEIVFDDATLDTSTAHANLAFCAIFEEQVERALARLPPPSNAAASVRSAARAALAAGGCTLSGTARALGMSSRTLQRRLKAERTSFAEIVDALRREMAFTYLERQIPTPEIASLLGYADVTAFHHAFRRGTGSSPSRHANGTRPH